MLSADLEKNKYLKSVSKSAAHMAQHRLKEKRNNKINMSKQIKQRVDLNKTERENFEAKSLAMLCSDFNTHRKLLHPESQGQIITDITKQISKIKDVHTVLNTLELIYRNILGSNSITKKAVDSVINKIFLKHLQTISPDSSIFEKRFNDIININVNKNAKTEAFKKKFKAFFDQVNYSKEASLLRLSGNPAFSTDPDGIDPIELLPTDFKYIYFGQFQENRIYVWNDEYGPWAKSLAERMLEESSAWNQFNDDPVYQFERLEFFYNKAKMEIYHNAEDNSIETSINIFPTEVSQPETQKPTKTISIILRDRCLDGLNYPKIQNSLNERSHSTYEGEFDEIVLPNKKWRYNHPSNFTDKRLIAVKIRTADREKPSNSETNPQHYLAEDNPKEFLEDPFFLLYNYYDEYGEKISDQDQNNQKFVFQWEKVWKEIQSKKNEEKESVLNFIPFPGEHYAPIPQITKDILNNLLDEAIKRHYDGISCDPAYFHIALQLRRMGFKFDNIQDESTYRDIQNSLVAIENHLQHQAYEENFFNIYKENIKHMADDEAKQEADKEASRLARETRLTSQEKSWIVVLNQCEDKKLIPEEYRLCKVNKNGETIFDKNQQPIFLSWPTTPEHFVWMTLYVDESAELISKENGEKTGDELIADNTVTGYTYLANTKNQNQPSQLESLIDKKSNEPTIVYHMYANDTKQNNYSRHISIVKKALSQFNVEVTEEKNILGNVKNPGPNRPFGWETDEAAYVENGIEKSQQTILIIKCQDIKKLNLVLEYLNSHTWKKDETDLLPGEKDLSIDESWVVPDIQVFNVNAKDIDQKMQSHFLPMKLNIKQCLDGKIFTMTTKHCQPLRGYESIDILAHKAMYGLIQEQEAREGEQQAYSR